MELEVWEAFSAPERGLGTDPEANAFRGICRLKLDWNGNVKDS